MPDDEISPKCKVRLETLPNCSDMKELRSYALCWARYKGQPQGMNFSTALKQGWAEAKKACQV